MIKDRGLRYWLPTYVLNLLKESFSKKHVEGKTKHIMFLICDHYEPRHSMTELDQDVERVNKWSLGYKEFSDKCLESFGHAPKHTWFYPPHHGLEHLNKLTKLVFQKHGEVELHYHHENDTSDTFKRDMIKVLSDYNSRGLLLTVGNKPKCSFSFIHGDWALDNSCHGKYCGVNDELDILSELGCWGDFTMPSSNECQTRKINSIYYAVDVPDKPKSHDWGVDLAVGETNNKDFFLMQGPLGINFNTPKGPKIENSSLTSKNWGRPDRIKFWIKCNIHVKGKPEWIFVKLHTHGAIEKDFDSLFGDKAFQMHSYLNSNYNDGEKYKLHYVTAREAYNIAKAAESGCKGDPDEYRDFVISSYATSIYYTNKLHKLLSCTSDVLHLKFLESNVPSVTYINGFFIKSIEGKIEEIYVDNLNQSIKLCINEKSDIVINTEKTYRFELSDVNIDSKQSGNNILLKNVNNEVTLKLNTPH